MKLGFMKKFLFSILFLAVATFAAPKSAGAYYSDAAFQYIENRLPTAEITCNEGLQYYPNDQKLQMLLDRIKEAKDEQKNENRKNDPQQNQDQNKDQQDQQQNQDQNKDQQNQDQNQQNQNAGESSSSGSDQNQNQNQQNDEGRSSDDQGQSSESSGGTGEQPEQPEQPQQSEQPQQPEETPAQLSPEEASQLLKDFDEQNGERKPWKPIRGQRRPEKDW